MTRAVLGVVSKHAEWFELMHFTDQDCSSKGPVPPTSYAKDGTTMVLPPSKTTKSLRFVFR